MVTNAVIREISLVTQSPAVSRKGRPLLRRVSRCVRFFSESRVCVPTFTRESERGPFVRKVEKRDERWSEIELLLIVRVHREPGNVCI